MCQERLCCLSQGGGFCPRAGFSLKLDLFVTGSAPQAERHSAELAASLCATAGRPTWADIIKTVEQDSNGEAVATTLCGPQTLIAEAAPLLRAAGCHTQIETFML